ncbi:geranylgeranyl transferase type-2 subunit alpha 1 isoform X1 [Syzygium oleosum]|uniref:geranylgeranyl transferase type-2 subunit alpha 1 isoform X1 n=1 Tax=Syzygium oleosum TaxID=219896 RepID=UPI0024B9BEA0|nr:geranylgeranyl transferase type-2 subunit alpha 1 isoform X1 [Syzygium oleosum]
MHGRPRTAPKPEDAAASAAKAQKLRALQSQFLSYHHGRIYTKEALDASAKLLEVNPEYYTGWNYRKLAVEHRVKESESSAESVRSVFDEELKMVENALRQNFKSYGAWHHRKWVLSKGHSSLDHELRLLDRFQKADPRNFHAWNYRRFVAALLGRSTEDELQYTEDLIGNNFSNYSAWHNRSMLLSEILKRKEQESSSQDIISKEYEFVLNALYTDPDDQSGWFYHLWLLDQTFKVKAPLLVSSWPVPGSELIVSGNVSPGDHPLTSFSEFTVALERFPVVLYFNQTVEGVNSSTVTIQCTFVQNEDVTWKPLSPQNSRASKVWVGYLDLSGVDHHSSAPHTIEVKLGHHQGINSSNGLQLSVPFDLSFTVSVKSLETQSSKDEKVAWEEDKFYACETHLQVAIPSLCYDGIAVENTYKPTTSDWQIETITEEISQIRNLLAISDSKIGKITLARLLMAHDAMSSPYATKTVHAEEVLGLYSELMKLDPSHSQYYKDERSLVLLQQLLSSRGMLLRHCFYYGGITSSSTHGPICLRLNNQSISRMGSFDKLLWVQMLDLSDNELHSIEGLEAMQLLHWLNLGRNKLRSFTALGPLRCLKSLKVLNISHNEIGLHSIDTTRYSCSASPLSHNGEIIWNGDEFSPENADVTNYWEAFMVFKSLELTQLDIVGNAVANEKFKSFLLKVLPKLQFLDGQNLH